MAVANIILKLFSGLPRPLMLNDVNILWPFLFMCFCCWIYLHVMDMSVKRHQAEPSFRMLMAGVHLSHNAFKNNCLNLQNIYLSQHNSRNSVDKAVYWKHDQSEMLHLTLNQFHNVYNACNIHLDPMQWLTNPHSLTEWFLNRWHVCLTVSMDTVMVCVY